MDLTYGFAASTAFEAEDESRFTGEPRDEVLVEERPSRVVVAEDQPHLRQLLVTFLRRQGHDVFAAEDGEQAVDHLGALWIDGSEPDLILTDVQMPGRSGLEVLAYVRGLDWNVPVVVMSGTATEDVVARAKELGANAVLAKPFNIVDLERLVRELIPPRGAPTVRP